MDASQEFIFCPFNIVIDSNETALYTFEGFHSRKSQGGRPIAVKTVRKALYAMGKRPVQINGKDFTPGLADYSIEGLEEEIQIERKSLEDLYNTLGGRRDKFEAEIARLNECKVAAVVIEAGWTRILAGSRASKLNPVSVTGTITAWEQRYRNVHWHAMPTRRLAEAKTFRMLERFWRDREKKGC